MGFEANNFHSVKLQLRQPPNHLLKRNRILPVRAKYIGPASNRYFLAHYDAPYLVCPVFPSVGRKPLPAAVRPVPVLQGIPSTFCNVSFHFTFRCIFSERLPM